MKWASLMAAILVAGCATAPAPATRARFEGVFPLANPSFETPAAANDRCAHGWDCTMHSNTKSFRFFPEEKIAKEGKLSFCIEPVLKEPWALLTQGTFDKRLHGARLRFSLAVHAQAIGGRGGGAGPWAQVRVPGQAVRTHQKMVPGTQGWETHVVEFDVPENATSVEVGAMLRGTGRACFDDARLEVLPARNPV